MDLGTLLGIAIGLVLIVISIMLGGDIGSFVNIPSIVVVFGGVTAATLVKFPLKDCIAALKIGGKIAFKNSADDPRSVYDMAIELAGIVRQKGLLGLESVAIENELMARGIRMCVDGMAAEVIKESITKEVDMAIKAEMAGESFWRGIGDMAPAFGMIGTLIGLVQMLANLSDPAAIGPAMAVAMLTTFYGAVLANLIAIPLADKLGIKIDNTKNTRALIIESVMQIHASQNPMVLQELLGVYLPGGKPPEEEGE
ncbi:flagellar motor protein PomA [Terasakiella brassicae]|uniref:Flagellar motor protein PomA n=1 Tax=Terasakiella brassicae TaxID=1634917 RepID=A0A917FDY7_9PROT|nr:MotA/TolQ/ExbB proton channel family protein [Terasakiella brassicae]GGF66286.1 flagellar motor protein PomA [Terasakiella brassicae]